MKHRKLVCIAVDTWVAGTKMEKKWLPDNDLSGKMHSAERKGQNALCGGHLKAALCVKVHACVSLWVCAAEERKHQAVAKHHRRFSAMRCKTT